MVGGVWRGKGIFFIAVSVNGNVLAAYTRDWWGGGRARGGVGGGGLWSGGCVWVGRGERRFLLMAVGVYGAFWSLGSHILW